VSGIERFTQWHVLPDGLAEDNVNAHIFAVRVQWRGVFHGKHGGGWAITNGVSEMSRGGSWSYYVPRFRRWQHRWETFEDAQEIARAAVDSVRINGRTWAEFQAQRNGGAS
jgi:hypothetical protein